MKKINQFMRVSAVVALLGALFASCSKEYVDRPVVAQGGSISAVVRNCPTEVYLEDTNLPLFPLDSVKAVLIDSNGMRLDSIVTNQEGQLNFINLPQGQYTVLLSHKRASHTLTLPATVTEGKIAYLASDGFDCINFQLYKIQKKKWTFIHLINNSDGTIAGGNIRDVRIQEKFGGSGSQLNNVAFFDCGRGSSKLMYLVETPFIPDPDPLDDISVAPTLYSPAYVYSRNQQDYEVVGDLGDYRFVQRKIEQLAAIYPADSIALFIESHGSGIDQTSGYNDTRSISPNPSTHKEITMPQLREMLCNLQAKGVNVGMVATPACFMGMFEVAYELKNTGVRYLLASEAPGAGLIDHKKGVEFIEKFKEGTGNSYQLGSEVCNKPSSDVFALFDLEKMDRMAELYNAFAEKINQTPVKYTQPIIKSTTKASLQKGMESNYTYNYYDLGDYALQISKAEFPDTHSLKPAALSLYNYIKDRSGFIAAMGVSHDTDWQKRLTGISTLLVAPGTEYGDLASVYRSHLYYKDGNTAWDTFLGKINWADPEMEVWDGSVSVPTQMPDQEVWINLPSELAWVAQQVNNGVQDFNGKRIVLKNDLDLGGRNLQNWTPIGMPEKPFKGVFDGGTHHIFRLYINTSKLSNVGLFGCIADAEITNCTLESGTVIVSENPGNAGADLNVGAICGSAKTVMVLSNITKSTADVSIKVDAEEALVNAGGLFGEMTGNFLVEDCTSFCSISASSGSKKMLTAGGIVGNCRAGTAMAQMTLKRCMFINGQIIASSDGDGSVGGYVGASQHPALKIVRAENSSTLALRAAGYAYVGGVVGNSTSPVTIIIGNNLASITASVVKKGDYSRAYAGGMVGAASAMLYGCSSNGIISGNDLKGALAGELDGSVTACSAIGSDIWGIAASVPSGKSVIATDTYYNSLLGAVGVGPLTRNNCELFSASKWPESRMKGWGMTPPDGVDAADWTNAWKDLGKWNAGKPIYPELKQIYIK